MNGSRPGVLLLLPDRKLFPKYESEQNRTEILISFFSYAFIGTWLEASVFFPGFVVHL